MLLGSVQLFFYLRGTYTGTSIIYGKSHIQTKASLGKLSVCTFPKRYPFKKDPDAPSRQITAQQRTKSKDPLLHIKGAEQYVFYYYSSLKRC